jgi:antitoxin component YwqK of YwqJK toxin-antitoxin module
MKSIKNETQIYQEDEEGRKQGEFTEFNQETKLPRLVCNYVDNLKSGQEIEYDNFGLIKVRCNYLGGKKHGLFESFYDGKQVFCLINYINGIGDGLYITYLSDGDPREAGYKKAGLLHGECIKNDRMGINESHCVYENGDVKRDLRKKPFENEEKKMAWVKRYKLPMLDQAMVDKMTKYSR